MLMRGWLRRGMMATTVAVLSVAMAGVANAASSTESWDFSEVAPGSPVPASESFGVVPLYAASNTDLRAVSYSGRTALDYDAWRDLAPGQTVDQTAAMLSTDSGFESDRYGGSDHGSSMFDPGTGDFAVSLWVKPTPASQFPLGSTTYSKVSPNVVQKGRSNAAGGYWKVYLKMAKIGGALVWTPACVIKGGNGVKAKANTGRHAVPMTDGVGYTLTCARVGGDMTMTMTPDGGTPIVVGGTTGATMSVSNSEAVSVGHKPKTTDPTDVYDGLLGSLTISMG